MKKKISLIVSVLIALLFLASCGESSMNPGVTTESLFDNSENQQRFLARPDASVMVNPKSYLKTVEKGKMGDGSLNLALVDNSGEEPVIKAEFDDVLFYLEDNTSNGKGGNVLFKTDFTELTNLKCDEKVIKYTCNGNSISFCVYDNGTNTDSFWAPLNFTKDIKCDFNKQVMCFLNIPTCEESCSLKFTPSGKSEIIVKPDGKSEGFLSFNLTELLGMAGKKSTISMNFFAIGFDKYVTFDRLDIIEFDPGLHFSGKELPESTKWAPYNIKTQIAYPNGLEFETTDYIIGSNGIVRNLRTINGGDCVIAGKYDGKISYDKNLGIIVEGKDASYVIVSKRKLTPIFYAAEEDLVAKTNGSEEPIGTSGIWTMETGNLANDIEVQFAIYIGATVEDAKEFAKSSKNDMIAISKESFAEDNHAYWDEYIAKNILPTPYIINAPETN